LRIQHRLAFGVANGAASNVLVVPAGRKYEILELGYWGTSTGGGINIAEAMNDGTTLVFDNVSTYPAGVFADKITHESLCLEAGDTYVVACNFTTAGATFWVTYMDVGP